MRQRLQLAAILLFTFLVFLPEIHYSLVYDDYEQLVINPRLTSWSYFPGYFTAPLWAHLPLAPPTYYRPLFLTWFRLVYAMLGAPGPMWHLASVLAHLVAAACVFLLIRRLGVEFQGAALATALFAIYPIQTETVAWVSSSGDLLLTSFLLLSVYFYAGRKGPLSLPSILFAALAMFTKEPGIVAPLLIFAYEWTRSSFKNAVISAPPYVITAVLYFGFRTHALGGPIAGEHPAMSVGAMVLTWPRLLAIYARHLIWPVHLSLSYDVPIGRVVWPLLPLVAAVAGLAWLVRGSCANVRFGAAWFAITLVPALAIRYMTWNDYVHDRYLYLPSVGLALIAAVWLSRIRFTLPRSVAACAIALALCWTTRSNLRIWQDNISLFRRAVETAPRNVLAKDNLVTGYLNAHRGAEAFPLLQQLMELCPSSPVVNYNMAVYYQQAGNAEATKQYLSFAEQLGMNGPNRLKAFELCRAEESNTQ
jgi:protein O-mannosyl-transferase